MRMRKTTRLSLLVIAAVTIPAALLLPSGCGKKSEEPAGQHASSHNAAQHEQHAPTSHKEIQPLYTCPMHPKVISDKPGRCPECGMNLVPKAKETTVATDAEKTSYVCPMHPNIVSDRPGNCPICGMNLVLVKSAKGEGIEGRKPVHLTFQQQQLINLRTTPVSKAKVSKTIRAVGIVAYDETKVANVNTRVMGWVHKLHVDKPGQPVQQGEPLMDLYSPELYSGQQEYLLAYRHYHELKSKLDENKSATSSSLRAENLKDAESLMRAAQKRLDLWEIPATEIEAVEKSGKPRDTLLLKSPVAGFVVDKKVNPGQMVQSGMTLYRVADLSTVWINVDLYEYELPMVEVGQKVLVKLTAYPDKTFEGKVDFIYPYLEIKTRTATVRLVLENPEWILKPNMYAHVEIHKDLGEQTVVPASALFDTGKRQYVFVRQGEGYFVPRLVKIGVKAGNVYVVREGLSEGEHVVTDGNFLLDSESQLRAAVGGGGHQH